jgi:hypothetical protein
VIAKGMTGMGGGLLSAGKVKKELQAITEGLQETFLAQEAECAARLEWT